MNYASNIPSAQPAALPLMRSRVLFGILLVGMGALTIRAIYLQSVQNHFLQQKGNARAVRVIDISAHRGMISDRHGEPLAISTPVESIWASPQDVKASPQQVEQLARILDMGVEDVRNRLFDNARDFVYLKRQLPPEQAENVMKLGIPGISLRREYRRYYPNGNITAHLLGFTDVDDNGQEGLELAFQKQLGGQVGSQRVIKDRKGHIIEDVASIRAPKPGINMVLSIDNRIQYLAFREIKLAVEQHRAKAGSIIVLDAKSGEVLALANWPSYNPNNRIKPDPQLLRNHAVTDLFEPGSTLKPFAIATGLDKGNITPQTVINTENGVMLVGKRKIHDTHPEAALTVAQVIQKSSNVGAAKIALSLPPETFWHSLNQSGFGTLAGSGFPGEATGRLRNYRKWRPIEQATISYGHGISVSLLQLARAYTIFANNGELKPVSWVKLDAPASGNKVYSENTAREVLNMLELAVLPGGTAPMAQISGFRVAGKTGTAHKLDDGRYINRYISSFVGLAPVSNPKLIIAVMVNEPNNGQYYGGLVAAPVFSNVMSAALRQLNVPNDAPLEPTGEKPPVYMVKEET